ncbi:MAG TPA: glycosyltransferase family 2 protein [Candidatus Omnitrophota bacterium]|nr:glycosyltransferase family 2 protein [Candidatus Omnitrophota bacterium]
MEARKDNTIVLIPSYNEAKTVGSLVRHVIALGFPVIVIDDGSTDNGDRIASDNGATVIRNKENVGKGLSLRAGIEHIANNTSYEWTVLMDADGQHHPEDIINLVNATSGHDVDMVVGNRMASTKNMPLVRYCTNRFMSWVLSRICGQDIADSQCGYRLIRVAAAKRMDLEAKRFDIESEMLMEAARKRFKIVSAPVQTIYGDEVSKINPFRDTFKFLFLIIRYGFKKNGSGVSSKTND